MGMGRMLAAGAAAMALALAATPAEAQRWGGGWHHRGHDRIDGGDVLLGALLAGGIIAIASAADHKDRDARAADDDYRDAPPPPADAPPPPPMAQRMADSARPGPGYADIASPDAAADACAEAAESSGTRFARIARVGAIDSVDPSGPNWLVRGTIDMRDDYRAPWRSHGFQCTIAGAGAPMVRIEGFAAQ